MNNELNKIITFEELKKTPLFFCHELIEEKEDSFVLLQYGPYLTTYHSEYFFKRIDLLQNSKLIFMAHVSGFLHYLLSENMSVGEIKKRIIILKTHARGRYADDITRICNLLIAKIRSSQMNLKTLESAMLNFSPIVRNSDSFLKYPELIQVTERYLGNENTHLAISELDNIIDQYIRNYIIQILLYPELFIPFDSAAEHLLINEDIFTSNDEKLARKYFTLVYLRYSSNGDSIQKNLRDLINLKSTANKLVNGKRISIEQTLSYF